MLTAFVYKVKLLCNFVGIFREKPIAVQRDHFLCSSSVNIVSVFLPTFKLVKGDVCSETQVVLAC